MSERNRSSIFRIIFIVAALFFVGLAVLTYIRFNNLINASAWVSHTQEVKLELDYAFTALVQAESAQRGYLQARDSSFLTSYFDAFKSVGTHIDRVDSLTADNASQQQNVKQLRGVVNERLEYLQGVLDSAADSAVTPKRMLIGKAIMDRVSQQIKEMQLEEDRLMDFRSSWLSRESLITPLFTFILFLGSMAILGASYFKIIQELKVSESLKTTVEERESRIQSIFDVAPDAVITIDLYGNINNWNGEAEKLFGWVKNEVMGKTLTETIIPERFREHHIRGIEHYIKTGEGPVLNKPIEIFAIRKDGTEFPIELKISASKVNQQSPIFIGFIRDVTQRKKNESALKIQAGQLIEAQQLAHIGSWEWDVAHNKIQWSDELYRIYGLTPQEFEADYENFLKYIHPDDREFVNGTVQKAFQDHQPFSFIHRLVRPDHSERIVSSRGKVFADSNGNTIRMAGTAQDVTEQKKYEAELQKSEERFIKIFDSNPIAMTLSEIKTNKIRHANQAFCSVFGYSKQEVIGRTSEELSLIAPEENARLVGIIMNILQESRSLEELRALSLEETEELLYKLKQSDAMKDLEIQYTAKSGKTFPAIVSFEVLVFQNESFTVTSYQDITDRKKAEVLLKKQNLELGVMNKELEAFNYIASHDLQEPLRKIQTFVTRILVDEEKNLSDRGKEYFVRMQSAANRMQTLIVDLLTYSRASKSERRLEYTDLNEVVRDVQEEFKEIIDEKHATIDLGDLGHANVIVFQFRQLIHNLISNALKFSLPSAPPQIIIRRREVKHNEVKDVNLLADKAYFLISIADNGIGFDPQYKDQIFELFKRLHDQKMTGSGIGLAIVKKIVENHHGVITATGELNKGATFDIYFPVA